ncbi:MAG: hypothetical protein J5631_14510 [Spirochaetaceae bacterium]|nr:hypothetical protein [Spirochaetaceae bacterium]
MTSQNRQWLHIGCSIRRIVIVGQYEKTVIVGRDPTIFDIGEKRRFCLRKTGSGCVLS